MALRRGWGSAFPHPRPELRTSRRGVRPEPPTRDAALSGPRYGVAGMDRRVRHVGARHSSTNARPVTAGMARPRPSRLVICSATFVPAVNVRLGMSAPGPFRQCDAGHSPSSAGKVHARLCPERLVIARPAWSSGFRPGRVVHGAACFCLAVGVSARQSAFWRGKVVFARLRLCSAFLVSAGNARLGLEWHGNAWRGVRHGVGRHSRARMGLAFSRNASRGAA